MAEVHLYKRINMQAVIANLPSSKRGGYVEDAVDVQLIQFADEHNKLVDAYNEVVQRDAAQQVDEEVGNQARELIAAANKSAREFLENARQHADSIRTEAEADVQEQRAAVAEEVDTKRAAIDAEVEQQRADLAAEVAEAHARLDRETEALRSRNALIRGETQVVFGRIRSFYETQLGTLGEAAAAIMPEDEAAAEVVSQAEYLTVTAADEPAADDTDASDDADEPDLLTVEDADVEVPVTENAPKGAASR